MKVYVIYREFEGFNGIDEEVVMVTKNLETAKNFSLRENYRYEVFTLDE